ncbi:hypothetical protein Tco_1013272 [Tanacetum coccineum]
MLHVSTCLMKSDCVYREEMREDGIKLWQRNESRTLRMQARKMMMIVAKFRLDSSKTGNDPRSGNKSRRSGNESSRSKNGCSARRNSRNETDIRPCYNTEPMAVVPNLCPEEIYLSDYCSDDQYAISIKEDTAYLCLHSPKITETRSNTPYPRKTIRRIQAIWE